jgi:hypothetical protein
MKVKLKWGTLAPLTAGKIYDVINELAEYYKIVNDDGILKSYIKHAFEVIPEGKTMKVKCTIDNLRGVSKNSVYDVINELKNSYQIVNDKSMLSAFNKDWFEVVPEPAKVKTIASVHSHPWLTLARTYDVLYEDKNFYGIIGDNGVQNNYLKFWFEVVQEAEPAPSKIRTIEYATTTDDKIHLSQEKAEAHQKQLDLKADLKAFRGPFKNGHARVNLALMVIWAQEQPESFQLLGRLVKELKDNG